MSKRQSIVKCRSAGFRVRKSILLAWKSLLDRAYNAWSPYTCGESSSTWTKWSSDSTVIGAMQLRKQI